MCSISPKLHSALSTLSVRALSFNLVVNHRLLISSPQSCTSNGDKYTVDHDSTPFHCVVKSLGGEGSSSVISKSSFVGVFVVAGSCDDKG